jgi:hypothetical protein
VKETQPPNSGSHENPGIKKSLTVPPPLLRYQARLAARPLLTQAITTSILFGIGDVAAQQLVDRKGIDKHDLARTGRMALYGGGTFTLLLSITTTTIPPSPSPLPQTTPFAGTH